MHRDINGFARHCLRLTGMPPPIARSCRLQSAQTQQRFGDVTPLFGAHLATVSRRCRRRCCCRVFVEQSRQGKDYYDVDPQNQGSVSYRPDQVMQRHQLLNRSELLCTHARVHEATRLHQQFLHF
jgi:hypothetical protein